MVEDYALGEMVGEGEFGKVFRALHVKTKHEVAIKVVRIAKFLENPKLEECTVNEIKILNCVADATPHVVKFIELLRSSNNYYFVYEFCSGGTLEDLFKKQGHLQEPEALCIFAQLLAAFKVLQKNNILHRDLKPTNILIHDGVVKLADFGFCKALASSTQMAQTMLGSPLYMAPEILRGQDYCAKADIWSLGVVLFETLFGYCPFEEKSIASLIGLLESGEVVIPRQIQNISQETEYLLRAMLVKDPQQRVAWDHLFELEITQSGKLRFPENNRSSSRLINEGEEEQESFISDRNRSNRKEDLLESDFALMAEPVETPVSFDTGMLQTCATHRRSSDEHRPIPYSSTIQVTAAAAAAAAVVPTITRIINPAAAAAAVADKRKLGNTPAINIDKIQSSPVGRRIGIEWNNFSLPDNSLFSNNRSPVSALPEVNLNGSSEDQKVIAMETPLQSQLPQQTARELIDVLSQRVCLEFHVSVMLKILQYWGDDSRVSSILDTLICSCYTYKLSPIIDRLTEWFECEQQFSSIQASRREQRLKIAVNAEIAAVRGAFAEFPRGQDKFDETVTQFIQIALRMTDQGEELSYESLECMLELRSIVEGSTKSQFYEDQTAEFVIQKLRNHSKL